ncbi:MAG: TonB-dependent receptor [Draconibacterium sp.]|nr:TonB-dependent receptor [Draconibacterium sp.]
MKKKSLRKCAQHVLIFSKWSRKSYSLFQTLNRIVVISVLTVSYLLSVPAVSSAADQDTTEVKIQYDLDEIEVSAQRAPAIYSQVARIVSVIERKEIESSPAQSVQELLGYVAGVDVRQRGAEGVQADVSIRGGTFDQTLILLNGINITDPQTGHHNLNLPLSLSQIDHIEVLEGPAARIYGPNAFSGAINIVSKQFDFNSIKLYLGGGSFGFFNSNLSGSFKTGKLKHSVALNRKSSNGYINNTDFGISNLFYSNQLNVEKGKLNFQLGASQKGFGANSFYTPKYPNQYEETKTLFSSIKWESNSKIHLTPVIYWRRNQDRFELFRNNPAPWYKIHNYHLTNVYGGNLNSWIQWKLGKTAFGVELRSENILSNVLGEAMDSPKKVPGENAEFTKLASRNTTSGFLEHSVYLYNWSLTAGLLSNFILGSDLGVNVFPGIDVSYNLTQAIKLYSSYNTSLRMPTFTDLYYSGPTNIGNPNLAPEKSATLEGGLKLNKKLLQGHIVVFYRQGKDIIDWVKKEGDDVWQAQNLTHLVSLGTEVQVQFNLQEQFGRPFPNKINLSYFNNNLKKENFDYISNYVLDNLKNKLIGSINQKIVKNLWIDLKVLFQDREGTYTEFVDGGWGSEVEYKPFWMFDAKLNYNWTGLNIFISANNIFNVAYNDLGNVVQPGRWIKAGISYQLKFD